VSQAAVGTGLHRGSAARPQISLTMNTYSHVMPAMMRDLADKMDAILKTDVVEDSSDGSGAVAHS